VSISVAKLWPFFSADPRRERRERTEGNVSISPSPSSSVPAPSIQIDNWISSRFGPRCRDNDYRPGKLPLKRFLDQAYLVTQCSIRRESEISIQFDQHCRIVTPMVIDIC